MVSVTCGGQRPSAWHDMQALGRAGHAGQAASQVAGRCKRNAGEGGMRGRAWLPGKWLASRTSGPASCSVASRFMADFNPCPPLPTPLRPPPRAALLLVHTAGGAAGGAAGGSAARQGGGGRGGAQGCRAAATKVPHLVCAVHALCRAPPARGGGGRGRGFMRRPRPGEGQRQARATCGQRVPGRRRRFAADLTIRPRALPWRRM